MVATRHLFCPKYGLEVSEIHTISTNFEPRDCDSWSLTTLCIAYCLMIPRKRLLFDENLLDSTTMRWWRHYTAVHTMVYFFIVYPARRHEKYLKRLTITYAELINQVRSSRTNCTDLAIIGQSRLLMQSNMQEGVRPVKSMRILYTNPQSYSTPQSLHGHLKHGKLTL